MTSKSIDSSLEEHIRELQRSIGDIEIILNSISHQYKESHRIIEGQFAECNRALGQVKDELHQICDVASTCGIEPIPDTTLKDKKLLTVWRALYRFHDGATADTIADVLGKHRTTVSTYLNMLVDDNHAEKNRNGHEIYYKAIIQREE